MHRYNDWHDGAGTFGWVIMLLLMLAFWGGLAWVIVNLARHRATHDTHGRLPPGTTITQDATRPAQPAQSRDVGPEDILHDRLARGDIDVEEYQARIDALRSKRPS